MGFQTYQMTAVAVIEMMPPMTMVFPAKIEQEQNTTQIVQMLFEV